MEKTARQYEGYQIEHIGTFPMVRIKAVGQGRIPAGLEGLYTTVTEAQRAIDGHLATKGKGKPNGKTKGSKPS